MITKQQQIIAKYSNFQRKKEKYFQPKKKRINWSQSLKSVKPKKPKVKKSLKYVMFLRLFNIKDFENKVLLAPFLTRYGKIRPRRKTRLPVQRHHKLTKTIRKARARRIIPFACNVVL